MTFKTVYIDSSLMEDGTTTGKHVGDYSSPTEAPGARVLIVEMDESGYEMRETNEFAKVMMDGTFHDALIVEDANPYLVAQDDRSEQVSGVFRLADNVLTGKVQLNTNGDLFYQGTMFTGDMCNEFMSIIEDNDLTGYQLQAYVSANPLNALLMTGEDHDSIQSLIEISPDVAAAYDLGADTFIEIRDQQRTRGAVAIHNPDTERLDIFECLRIGSRQDERGRTGYVGLTKDAVVEWHDNDNPIPLARLSSPYTDTTLIKQEFGFTPDDGLMAIADTLRELHTGIRDMAELDCIGTFLDVDSIAVRA